MGSLPKEESINALQINDGEINEEVSESKEKTEACKKSNIKSSDMVNDSKENEKNSNPVLSKKALKRQRRWEEKLATKKRRKEHDKESKKAKAILEGRDLEKERREVELRTKNGEGRKRREKIIMERIKASADNSFQVCLDCSFEEHMTEKEINSLASQIRYCYAYNRRATHPVYLSVTSLSGTTRNVLEKVDGFPDSWVGRGFSHHTDAMEKVHDLSRLVYLTSDSPNVINDLDDTKIYVIGGIVDRNRLKRATVTRAEQLGIATAKLPINEFLDLTATNVLTCNHVFDILMKFKENGKDWKKSFLEVLPERKDAQER